MTMRSQFADMTSLSFFFDVAVFLLSSLVTGPMTIFVYKGLTKIWKSEVPPSEFCPISEDWSEKWKVKNEKLLNAPKCQGYSFYPFRGKTKVKIHPPLPPLPPRLESKRSKFPVTLTSESCNKIISQSSNFDLQK